LQTESAMNPPSSSSLGANSPGLRNSCEACAAAKLRCPKEKPTCHRCAKRGIVCEYFAIKRAGRKPGSRSNINGNGSSGSASNNVPARPPERTHSHQDAEPRQASTVSGPMTMFDQSLPNLMDVDAVSDIDFTDGHDFDFFSPADFLPHHAESGESSGSSIATTDGGGSARPRDQSFSTTFSNLDIGVPELFTLPSPNSTDWNTAFPDLDLSESSCSCLVQAVNYFTRLSQLSSTVCTTFASVDLDNDTTLRLALNVVEQNKATISAVSVILHCPNYHDGCLLALVSFIIFKMLSLYAAVACKEPNIQNLPAAPAVPTPLPEPVLPSQGILDNYPVERNDDPQHMPGRIVLGELRRVRYLIVQLVEKLKSQSLAQGVLEGTQSQESMDLDTDMRLPLSPVMYEQLDLDLRRRLKALSWAIVDRMTRL
jgi:hypothetical protein